MRSNMRSDFIYSDLACTDGIDTQKPEQNDQHFATGIYKSIFLKENFWIANEIELKNIPWGKFENKAALVQVMLGA